MPKISSSGEAMRWLYLLLTITVIVATVERFSHPELTEMQLFLRFWQLYTATFIACLVRMLWRRKSKRK